MLLDAYLLELPSTATRRLLLVVALFLGRDRARRRLGFKSRHCLRAPLLIPSFPLNILRRANSNPPPPGLSAHGILQLFECFL